MLDKQNPEVPDPDQISTSFLTSICIPYEQGLGRGAGGSGNGKKPQEREYNIGD